MAKKYLDYAGLTHLIEKLNQEYAPIQAIIFKSTVEDIDALPALNTVKAGFMYNLKKGGVTTGDFVEGAGHLVADGENVAAVELYTGAYTPVASVAVTDDPKAEGWYETDVVTPVTPVGTENPSDEGWFVASGVNYVPTTDTTVQSGTSYFTVTFKVSADRIADTTKGYYTADTVMKWDALGGLFDLEGRYLEFGETFPQGPASRMVDGRTFLFMGDSQYVYEHVASPSGRPTDNGYYEVVFSAVAAGDLGDYYNPKQQDLYEETSSGSGVYALSTDTTVDTSKTYYTAVGTPSTDTTVNPSKEYYTKADQYKKAAIYEYDTTTADWVIQSGGNDDFIPITDAEIDELFI